MGTRSSLGRSILAWVSVFFLAQAEYGQPRLFRQDGPLPAQTDGEIFSTDGRKIEVELIPSRIEVICRAQGGG